MLYLREKINMCYVQKYKYELKIENVLIELLSCHFISLSLLPPPSFNFRVSVCRYI